MAKQFGFSNKEKLKSRKDIESLFKSGRRFSIFPLRVIYSFSPGVNDSRLLIGVTVNKKNFRKAVDRNRIKRQLRESYRLQKRVLVEAAAEKQLRGNIFFIYTDHILASSDVIKLSMAKCIDKLVRQVKTTNEASP